MSASQLLMVFSSMCGGLALFLFGMSTMSSGLEKLAGGRMQSALKKITKNSFMGFLTGLGVTVVVQSSSAVMVMLVGLVNSSIIDFAGSVGVIIGSNVGTTITAWLVSLNGISGDGVFFLLLKPIIFSPIVALVGTFVRMLSKNEIKRNVGDSLVGFAILIIGMDMMGDSVSFIKDSQAFGDFISVLKNPVFALLVSVIFTTVIQSSSATIGIIQALALTGKISFGMAIPLTLGANIGTCITGLIATIGTSRHSKCVSVFQVFFNVIGTVVVLPLTALFSDALQAPAAVVDIAFVHTAFNILTSIVFVFINKHIKRLTEFIVCKKC